MSRLRLSRLAASLATFAAVAALGPVAHAQDGTSPVTAARHTLAAQAGATCPTGNGTLGRLVTRTPIRVLTTNVDWALRPARVKADLAQLTQQSDVLLVQEAKNVRLTRLVDTAQWGVIQNVSSKDRAGSAILYRKSRARVLQHGQTVGVRPHGVKMLTRWITWADLRVDGQYAFRAVSAHRPPARYKGLWPLFDANVRTFVARSPRPVILGADWNAPAHSDPAGLSRLGLRMRGAGIDGVMIDRRLDTSAARRQVKGFSDHRAVAVTVNAKPVCVPPRTR